MIFGKNLSRSVRKHCEWNCKIHAYDHLNREVDPEEMLGAEIKFPDVDIPLALSRCGKL